MKNIVCSILASVALCTFLASSGKSAEDPAGGCPSKRLLLDVSADTDQIHYLSQTLSKEEFQKQKKHELATLAQSLKQTYHVAFATSDTKYFNLAYRITPQKMNHLQTYLLSFFDQIYGKYFQCDLDHAIAVVYFETQPKFEKLTGSDAYGYYRAEDKALYTYGNSGYGTLWHEMIHAFLDQNQSGESQQWFDEGLASFYEMAALDQGRVIEGYTNWRLPSLQEAIRSGRITHLRDFLKERRIEQDFGLAQARFLFCYLWVHKQMIPFVKTYFYDLCPKYQGSELGDKAISLMEELLGKDIDSINEDFIALAKRVRTNQKLTQE